MSDYQCTGKGKATSGWPINQTGHLDSAADCDKMGCKGAEDKRAMEKAPELLEHSSMDNMQMRENSPYSRVL
jgi:hypothetical protein